MSELRPVTVDIWNHGDQKMLRFGSILLIAGCTVLIGAVTLRLILSEERVTILLIVVAGLLISLGVATIWFVYLAKKRDKAIGAIRLIDDTLRASREQIAVTMENQAQHAGQIRDQFKTVLDGFESNIQLAGKNAQHIATLIGSAELLDRTLVEASKLVEDQQMVLEQTRRNKEQELEKMALRQEAAEGRRRVDKWEQSAMNLFGALERSIAISREESYRRASQSLLEQLITETRSHGLEVIMPAPGERFNQDLHQIVEELPSDTIPDRSIVECAGWGFRVGDQVRRRAEVRVSRSGR